MKKRRKEKKGKNEFVKQHMSELRIDGCDEEVCIRYAYSTWHINKS